MSNGAGSRSNSSGDRGRPGDRSSGGRSSQGRSKGNPADSGRGKDRSTGGNRSRPGGPDQGSSGSRPRRGSKKIPPPPVIRDEVTIERVHDDNAPSKAERKKRQKARDVDVSDVAFPDVAPNTAQKLQRRLAEAALAFEAERFSEAENLLASIERLSPGVPEVIEMRALTYYRLGNWGKAINQLEAFYDRTGSVEQHPVWADCCRALRRWSKAEELWRELGDTSPSAELVEEGRIVQAGMLADRGRLSDAIRVLENGPRAPRKPGLHHLRRWYALGDLYERSGDLAHSRRVFADIVSAEPGFGDAAERLASLG